MDDGFIRQHGEVVAFPFAIKPRQWGDDVERVNHYPLYGLGKALRALEICIKEDGPTDARTLFTASHSARWELDSLMNGKPFPLGISGSATARLKDTIDRFNLSVF